MRGRIGWTSIGCSEVTISDGRAALLTRLLKAIARPGLCLVLGAGASYGVVPISKRAVMAAVRELHQAKGNAALLPEDQRLLLANPIVNWVVQQLPVVGERFFDAAWPMIEHAYGQERRSVDAAEATIIVNETFTPRSDVPQELIDIYKVLESARGTIVTYNYDRVESTDSGFRVVAPHGQRSPFTLDPRVWKDAQRIARQTGHPIPTDLHLPVPEHEGIRQRSAYRQTLAAWREADCVVLIGYAFGYGDDSLSFEDFGRCVRPSTAVHVVNPDVQEVTKQVAYGLKGRGGEGRVLGHMFGWQTLAAAILSVLDSLSECHVRAAVGREQEICSLHDRGCPSREPTSIPELPNSHDFPFMDRSLTRQHRRSLRDQIARERDREAEFSESCEGDAGSSDFFQWGVDRFAAQRRLAELDLLAHE